MHDLTTEKDSSQLLSTHKLVQNMLCNFITISVNGDKNTLSVSYPTLKLYHFKVF